MGNIRLYTIVFGFLFLFRFLALGPWIRVPLFTPLQVAFYQLVVGENLVYPLDENQSQAMAQKLFWYRFVIWVKEILIDGITWLGMIGLSIKREFFGRVFWKVWFFLCVVWQVAITLWLSTEGIGVVMGLLLSAAAPYLLWVYGWQRQWLQKRYE